MNLLMILLQEHAAESPSVFSMTANVSFWTVLIFLVLLGVLLKFAFPPILGYAAAREERIQQALDEAKAQRTEAEALLAQQRQQLAEARAQAQQVIAEGKQAAERVRQELLEKTRVEQQELVNRAKAEIVRERELAVEHVRREAIDLAIAAAGRLLGAKVDADTDRRIVSEYLESIGSQDPAGVA